MSETSDKNVIKIKPGHEIRAVDENKDALIGGFSPTMVKTVIIDAAEANRILMDWNHMPGQRKLDDKRVKEYSERIDKGLWHGTDISVALIVDESGAPVRDDDQPTKQKCFLINGQHSLSAIGSKFALSEDGESSRCQAKVTFKFYEVTLDQLDLLFSQFDDYKPRTGKIGIEPLTRYFGYRPTSGKSAVKKPKVSSKILENVGKAIYWESVRGMRLKCDKPSNHRIINIIKDNADFVYWLVDLHDNPTIPFDKDSEGQSFAWLWKIPVIAMMYKCWKASPETAFAFWMHVVRGTGTEEDASMPLQLRKMLKDTRGQEWGSKPQSRVAKACESAWNHWRHETSDRDLPQGTVPVDLSSIASLSEESLEYFYLVDVSPDSDALDIAPEVGANSIKKVGKMDDRRSIEESDEEPMEENL